MRGTWEAGERVIKCIGFDSTEDHRTYADGSAINICREKGLPDYGQRYEMRYPLREWGLSRDDCGKIISKAGLPLPPKSACFFCPAMKPWEIDALAKTEPELFALALEMERRYRAGKHFRGDGNFTVKGKHVITGEEEVMENVKARGADGARAIFRVNYDDLVKPFKYRLSVSMAVPGLGRRFAWSKLALPLVEGT